MPHALALLLAIMSSSDVIPPQPVDGTITWVYDYAEGKRLANASGKPMFIVIRCER